MLGLGRVRIQSAEAMYSMATAEVLGIAEKKLGCAGCAPVVMAAGKQLVDAVDLLFVALVTTWIFDYYSTLSSSSLTRVSASGGDR